MKKRRCYACFGGCRIEVLKSERGWFNKKEPNVFLNMYGEELFDVETIVSQTTPQQLQIQNNGQSSFTVSVDCSGWLSLIHPKSLHTSAQGNTDNEKKYSENMRTKTFINKIYLIITNVHNEQNTFVLTITVD